MYITDIEDDLPDVKEKPEESKDMLKEGLILLAVVSLFLIPWYMTCSLFLGKRHTINFLSLKVGFLY